MQRHPHATVISHTMHGSSTHQQQARTSQANLLEHSMGGGPSADDMTYDMVVHSQQIPCDMNAWPLSEPQQHQLPSAHATEVFANTCTPDQQLTSSCDWSQPCGISASLQHSKHRFHSHQAASLQPLHHPHSCNTQPAHVSHSTERLGTSGSVPQTLSSLQAPGQVLPQPLHQQPHLMPAAAAQQPLQSLMGHQSASLEAACKARDQSEALPASSQLIQAACRPSLAAVKATATLSIASQQAAAVDAFKVPGMASLEGPGTVPSSFGPVQQPLQSIQHSTMSPLEQSVPSAKTALQGWKRAKRTLEVVTVCSSQILACSLLSTRGYDALTDKHYVMCQAKHISLC